MTDYLSATSLFAAHRDAPPVEYRDVARSVLCTCGWACVAPGLPAALDRIERHLNLPTEACDHAVNLEDVK
jgi:hypothetical protein